MFENQSVIHLNASTSGLGVLQVSPPIPAPTATFLCPDGAQSYGQDDEGGQINFTTGANPCTGTPLSGTKGWYLFSVAWGGNYCSRIDGVFNQLEVMMVPVTTGSQINSANGIIGFYVSGFHTWGFDVACYNPLDGATSYEVRWSTTP